MEKSYLGNSNTLKTILRLALPAMVAQLVTVLYNIVDRIYVGNLSPYGQIALVGIGVCGPITTLISSFAFLIGLGGATLFSMALGEKNEEKAKRIMSNALLMLICLSFVLVILFYSLMDPMLYAFGASEASFEYAKGYLTIFLMGTFFNILMLGLNQYITAQGDSIHAMMATLIGCLLNIALDPLFMYTFKIGYKGAAIATIVCQFLSFLFVLFILLRKAKVKLSIGNYDFSIMWKIIKLGFSPFIIIFTDSLVLIALNSQLQRYGGDNGDNLIAIATIVLAFESLVTGPLLGISTGTQPILGYNFGAKNIDLIKKAEKQITIMAVIFCTICFCLSFLLAKPFATMFVGLSKNNNGDAQSIIDGSVKYIRVYMYGIIPLAFQYVFVDGLTGMGQAKYSMSLSLNRKLVLLLISIIILPIITKKAESAFYAELIADVGSGIITSIIYLLIIPNILRKQLVS